MDKRAVAALSSALSVVLALGACSPASVGQQVGSEPLIDGTFFVSIGGDPGSLDPHHAATYAPVFLLGLAYEGLVTRDPSGEIVPNLAESWEQTPNSVTFKLRRDVTCADGSPLTLRDVADNYRYVANPDNHSALSGDGGVPVGTRIEIDEAKGTLKLTTPKPYSFLLQMTGSMGIVCREGLEDRSRLRTRTHGSGLFQLDQSVSNSHYRFTRRAGYSWGPLGTRSQTPGVPKHIFVRVIPNQTTAANLLLAGELTAAAVSGADRRRIEAAGFRSIGNRAPGIQMWFNQAHGRLTSDETLRKALAAALDVPQLAKIASGGLGLPPRRLSGAEPMACSGNLVGAQPHRSNQEFANRLLDDGGWVRGNDGIRHKGGRRLSLSLIWDRDLNDPTSSAYAAEYAAMQWKAIGAEITTRSVGGAEVGEVLFGTGDYDISWVPIVVSMPSRFLPFVSGPTPPKGLNFPHAKLDGVKALAAEANNFPGQQSCPKWDEIERLYLTTTSVVPVFDSDNPILTRRATFVMNGVGISAPSIRLLK